MTVLAEYSRQTREMKEGTEAAKRIPFKTVTVEEGKALRNTLKSTGPSN